MRRLGEKGTLDANLLEEKLGEKIESVERI